MAKTKISEWSATASSNTDIDGINIAEGCAPSGINDAIREMMSQVKDFQSGVSGDSFNGPVGTTTAAAGAFTTLSASGAVTLSGGTANGVPYLNGSKVLTTGSALQFDGSNLGLGVTPSAWSGGGSLQLPYGNITGNTGINLSANSYYNGGYKYVGTGAATTYVQSGGQHIFYTAGSGTAGAAISFTQAMTLTANNEWLLGTTSFASSNSNSILMSAAFGAGYWQHASGTASGATFHQFNYNGSAIGSITQNGTTGVLYNITSDHRLKTVIKAVSDQGARIDALEPVEYEWKADGSRTRGFLAHKFQEVYPASVTGEKDAVDADGNPVYQQMQASTPEAMADIFAELKSLRARVAQLEAK